MMRATLLDFNYIKTCLQKLYGIELDKVLLYGSYARNTANEESDIDIFLPWFVAHLRYVHIFYKYLIITKLYKLI